MWRRSRSDHLRTKREVSTLDAKAATIISALLASHAIAVAVQAQPSELALAGAAPPAPTAAQMGNSRRREDASPWCACGVAPPVPALAPWRWKPPVSDYFPRPREGVGSRRSHLRAQTGFFRCNTTADDSGGRKLGDRQFPYQPSHRTGGVCSLIVRGLLGFRPKLHLRRRACSKYVSRGAALQCWLMRRC